MPPGCWGLRWHGRAPTSSECLYPASYKIIFTHTSLVEVSPTLTCIYLQRAVKYNHPMCWKVTFPTELSIRISLVNSFLSLRHFAGEAFLTSHVDHCSSLICRHPHYPLLTLIYLIHSHKICFPKPKRFLCNLCPISTHSFPTGPSPNVAWHWRVKCGWDLG